uniref:OprD family outer membrane porin n=1 Tax=Aestuariivirga sp. TaxID=2650926 RepID=UPI003784B13C
DQDGFSVLGQAYAALRYEDQVLTFYRQLVDQPEVNPHDNRMVPNTFEGISLKGDLGLLSYYAGYLTRMKTRDADDFVNMAKIAGVDQDEPMYLGGLSFAPDKDLSLKTSLYVVPNLLASSYTDGSWMTGQLDGDHIKLSAQFMIQSGIGDQLLTGSEFVTWMGGVLGEVRRGDLTLMAGYTANGTDNDWRYPYGMWPGYTNMIIGVFARAEEQAALLGATYDLSGIGLEGLTLGAQAALDTHVASGRAKWYEYDFSADYSFSAIENSPRWLSPLSLGVRYAILQSDNVGPESDESDRIPVRLDSDELRVIMNYQVQFSGKDL